MFSKIGFRPLCLSGLWLFAIAITSCGRSVESAGSANDTNKQPLSPGSQAQGIENKPEPSNSSQENPIASIPNPNASQTFTREQLRSLKSLNLPIVFPSYLPERFKLDQVETNLCKAGVAKAGCREGSSYTLVYRHPENICLLVSAVGGGVGGGAADFEVKVPSKLFGEAIVLFGDRYMTEREPATNATPDPGQMNIPQRSLFSIPLPLSSRKGRPPFYSVGLGDSSYYQQKYGCGSNSRVTPSELIKVLDGLAIL